MAYKRNYRRKRYTTKKPFKPTEWYNKKYSIGQMASGAWRATKYLASMINSERHILNTTAEGLASFNGHGATSTSGNFLVPLTSMAVGDTYNTRTGNSILVDSVHLKLTGGLAPAATQTYVKVIVLRDIQQQGDVTPRYNDLLGIGTVGSPLAPISSLHPGHLGRFKIIYSKNIQLTSSGNSTFWINKKLKVQKHVRFNGSSSVDIQKGGIYLAVITNESVETPEGSRTTPFIRYSIDTTYYDN